MIEPTTHQGQANGEARIAEFALKGGPFVAAVEATRMPMLVTDVAEAGNPIVYVNQAFLDLCGYEEADILGRDYFFLTGAGTDPQVEARMREAMGAEEALHLEVLLYTKSGREVWVAQFFSPIRDPDGKVVQHFASFWDITRRVRSERRSVRLAEVLEQRVEERTRQLSEGHNHLREEVERRRQVELVLTQSVREKDELIRQRDLLLREVNHRAKNSITMAIALLRLQGRQMQDGEVAMALENAIQRLNHFSKIHELLYVQQGDLQTVDMGDYLSGLGAEFRGVQAAQQGRIELTVDADPITLDVGRAINVALISGEAITNALKHAFPGASLGQVQLDLRRLGDQIELRIEDNGRGLPEELRAGSLGMKLMEGMVRTLQGELRVESGSGTRLVVTFPAARAAHDFE